jgi:hypothetical protein
MEIASKYRFVLCFENDLYPGYVTEKLPEAWATGAIPLYWGDDRSKYFNPEAFINLNNFDKYDDFLQIIRKINENEQKWTSVASRPLIKKQPSLETATAVLRGALRRKKLI